MSDGVSYKHLVIKKLGWQRVANNNMRFGWHCSNAEEHTTITTQTSYDGEIRDNKIYINEHEQRSTTIRIHLSFWRRKSDYKNSAAVMPIELLYNICFYMRRLIGLILPFLLAAVIIIALFGFSGSNLLTESGILNWLYAGLGVWLGLIILEGVFSRIAGKILGIKLVKRK